jgi:hypothetical protein
MIRNLQILMVSYGTVPYGIYQVGSFLVGGRFFVKSLDAELVPFFCKADLYFLG